MFPPRNEIRFSAVRSGGPGGQHVNKVNSAAILKWDFQESSSLSDVQKNQIQTSLDKYINKSGEIQIRSDEYRDLLANKERCLEKLEALLKKVFFKAKKRRKTNPPSSSRKKRLEDKKYRGSIKKNRSKVEIE